MVVMKRKITEEKDKFGGFDSVIEIDDVKGKSYNAKETERAEAVNYTSREAFANPAAKRKSNEELMPRIANQTAQKKAAKSEQKDAVSFKTRALLISYLAAAVILAAIVIATGVAVSNGFKKVDALQQTLDAQFGIILDQNEALAILTDDNAITGKAVNQLDMVKNDTVTEISLVATAEPVIYEASTNWFDKLCRWISSIFS